MSHERTALTSVVEGFGGRRVLVLGDMVADAYIFGRPARIDRAAPVLVLHHREERVCPGGAANVASNLAALGAQVSVGGVIGADPWGVQLGQALSAAGVDISGLIVDATRATATKTRIVAGGDQEIQQQIVRIDRVDQSQIDDEAEGKLIDWVTRAISGVDGLIVSDYENGVIGPAVLESALPLARQHHLVTTVDSHGDLFRFKGVTIATPNQPEAEATLSREMHSLADVESGGEALRDGMDADGVLITRGNQGMSLFQRGLPPRHYAPANVREVFDPTGAGDTASAVVTLGLLAGASMENAAALSNLAAGEVVKKLGNATLSMAELIGALTGLTSPDASPIDG